MIVYLDANVYISAKYQFNKEKFATLRTFISDGSVEIIYSSAVIGEVEKHIEEDIKTAVTKYNRLVRKDLLPLTDIEPFDFEQIDPDEAVEAVKNKLQEFLSLDGVSKIELNPIDADELMDAYFRGKPPFETKKPYEFKDAIMINSIKQYQKCVNEPILIVSEDEGFRRAFEDNEAFVPLKFLSDLFKHLRTQQQIEECIVDSLCSGIYDEVLKQHFLDFNIDRGYYSEWEYDDVEFNGIELYLEYVDQSGDSYIAYFDVVLYMTAEITHRDEDTSYYDKEEQGYLFENFVTWREHHRVELNVTIDCAVEKTDDGQYQLKSIQFVEDKRFPTIDLDEDTLLDWDDVTEVEPEAPEWER